MSTSTIIIKDPVSRRNVTVEVISTVDLEGETYSVVHYTAQTSAEVDCTFAVIESANGIACQNNWQAPVVSVDNIADATWVDCTPTDDDPEIVSATEAAEMLGVSRMRVNQLINGGKLEAHRIGNAWMISRASIINRLSNQ